MRKVLSDDFVGTVSLNLLRAFVPADDSAEWIEHENGVILDFLHQQPETFLSLPQFLVGLLPFRDIADRSHDRRTIRALPWAQTDFDWKRAPILASPVQYETYSHGTVG